MTNCSVCVIRSIEALQKEKKGEGEGKREREREKKNFVGNWKARLVRSRIQSWHNCQRCVSRDIVRLRPTVHRKQIRVRPEHAMALFVSFIDGPSSSECQKERERNGESIREYEHWMVNISPIKTIESYIDYFSVVGCFWCIAIETI